MRCWLLSKVFLIIIDKETLSTSIMVRKDLCCQKVCKPIPMMLALGYCFFAIETGKLLMIPPSIRKDHSYDTGGNIPGIAILPERIVGKFPLEYKTNFPVLALVTPIYTFGRSEEISLGRSCLNWA